MHQGRFAGTGNAGDDRKPPDREANIDILQIVHPRAMDLDPVLNRSQRSARFAGRMTKRILQTTTGLGIFRTFDVAQRSSGDDFAAMNSGAWAKIDNVIGAPHRFLIVLDDHE